MGRTFWDSSLLVSLTLWDTPVLFTPPLPLPQNQCPTSSQRVLGQDKGQKVAGFFAPPIGCTKSSPSHKPSSQCQEGFLQKAFSHTFSHDECDTENGREHGRGRLRERERERDVCMYVCIYICKHRVLPKK